ncbi:MAG TPA: sigma factor-like helix-turn-helix DNA-binding protein [Terriglobales bacterium]|nr:sigma factor-like helix-turn-helix DNA-binding protein [Terriglobales bacterium]
MSSVVLPCVHAVAELLGGLEADGPAEFDDNQLSPDEHDNWKLTQEDEELLDQDASSCSDDWGADPDLWIYRDRTVALLRRYARLAVECGRLPSLLGRDFFRSKITSYHAATFEDTVIFVHDVEMSLERLGGFEKKVIAMVVLEEFSQEEAGRLLGCSTRTVGRYIYEALDDLTEIFLRGSILKPLSVPFPNRETACQGGESDQFPLSDCNEGKNIF